MSTDTGLREAADALAFLVEELAARYHLVKGFKQYHPDTQPFCMHRLCRTARERLAAYRAIRGAEGEIARLREALATTDAEMARLRAALETLPFEEYEDAQMAGCDPNGAWDVFRAAAARHIRAALAPKEEP